MPSQHQHPPRSASAVCVVCNASLSLCAWDVQRVDKKFAKAGMLFKQLVETQLSEANATTFFNALASIVVPPNRVNEEWVSAVPVCDAGRTHEVRGEFGGWDGP